MRNKLSVKKWLLVCIALVVSVVYAFWYVSGRSGQELTTYREEEMGIVFAFPDSYRVVAKNDIGKSDRHLYIYPSDGHEVMRIHFYPDIGDDGSNKQFLQRLVEQNDITWQVVLYPKGVSDGGGFVNQEPVLYYLAYERGNKYSLQMNNAESVNSIQQLIINSLTLL